MTDSGHSSDFARSDAQVLADHGSLAVLIRLLKLGSFINTPMKEGVCDPHDIGQTEMKVVMALAGEGALAGHDLVNIMGMAPMNVSRAIASLRDRGLIEDIEDPDNRRRKPVRLSAAGEEFYKTFGPTLQKLSDEILGMLTARERASLGRLLDKVNGAMARWIVCHHEDVKLGRS